MSEVAILDVTAFVAMVGALLILIGLHLIETKET